MAEFSAHSKKLVELFNSIREEPKKFWNVPDYQRDFVWPSKQVLSFLDDLIDAYVDKSNSYFVGSMVFEKNGWL